MNGTRTKKHRQYNLFMLEIIIVILFFSVSSSVIVQLFVHAHTDSVNSRNSLKAVTVAQSVADCYRSAQNLESAAEILGYETNNLSNITYVSGFNNTDVVTKHNDGKYITANFDKNWDNITNAGTESIKFSLLAREVTEDNLTYATVDVADEKGMLFSIRAVRLSTANGGTVITDKQT